MIPKASALLAVNATAPLATGRERNLSIDRLRGALVILMVAGDYLSGVQLVPSFLKHAPDLGMTIADTVATAFVFVIGLNYGTSFHHHMKSGVAQTYRYFVTRYLALVGIGAIISAGSNIVGQPSDWGVLQALGVAGLITLVFIRFPTWARFIVGGVMLSGYQIVLNLAMVETVVSSVHGGLFGSLSWAGALIVSTAVADLWRRGFFPYAVCCAILVVLAAVSTVIVPVSKHRVSLSFILITLALSAIVFLVMDRTSGLAPARAGLLCWWGQNALALYLVHLILLAGVVAPPLDWWYVAAPLWLVLTQLAAVLGLMSVIACWLHRWRSSR